MRERMSEERWEHLNRTETVWTRKEQVEVAGEVLAAHISEMEKDARIRELEAALTEAERAMSNHPHFNPWDLGPTAVLATLRKPLGLQIKRGP